MLRVGRLFGGLIGANEMCDLCDEDQKVRDSAMKSAKLLADDLRRLACHYDAVASGRIKPHTVEAAKPESLAYSVIRVLVRRWV
jgi:hypothetical protein